MQKLILTIHGKDYPLESYNYCIHRSADSAADVISGISLTLGIDEENDLDSVMVSGLFSCTLTVCEETGAILKQLVLDDAKITSYSDSRSAEHTFTSIHISAGAVQFGGKYVTSQNEWY